MKQSDLRTNASEAYATRLLLSLYVTALLLSGCAHRLARSGPGSLEGQVVDEQGAPIQGLDLQLSEPKEGLKLVLSTDAQGRFSLAELKAADGTSRRLERGFRLKISAWKPGFEPRELELPFPGGKVELAPLVLPHEQLELSTDPASGPPPAPALPASPAPAPASEH